MVRRRNHRGFQLARGKVTEPISTRVNKPENDDPAIVEPIELAASAVD
jgi:hypothetical protein